MIMMIIGGQLQCGYAAVCEAGGRKAPRGWSARGRCTNSRTTTPCGHSAAFCSNAKDESGALTRNDTQLSSAAVLPFGRSSVQRICLESSGSFSCLIKNDSSCAGSVDGCIIDATTLFLCSTDFTPSHTVEPTSKFGRLMVCEETVGGG